MAAKTTYAKLQPTVYLIFNFYLIAYHLPSNNDMSLLMMQF